MNATPRDRSDRAPQMVQWITLAQRVQLERDLDDLPELAEHLEANYLALLSRGSGDPDDRVIRYPIEPTALDLADRRAKGFTVTDDPIGEADLALRIGERRLGVLPTLVGWVSLAAGEMHDLDVQHRAPSDPATEQPTIAGECLWLRQHIDWIVGQQWVIEFAAEVSGIVVDLVQLVGDGVPSASACMTGRQVVEHLNVSKDSLYWWARRGLLTDVGRDDRGHRLFVVHEVKTLMRG